MPVDQKQIKTIFFDRDGIINDVVIRGTVISSPRSVGEFQLRSDFLSFTRFLADKSVNVFVVSNQPDVSRDLLSLGDLEKMTTQIRQHIDITEVRYCTHDNAHNCDCRKPKPGMIVDLLEKYNLSADEAVIIGDSYKDILAGKAAGVATVYLLGSYNATIDCKPDFTISSLQEITQHYTFSRV